MYDRDPDTFEVLRRERLEGLSESEALAARQEVETARAARQAAMSAVREVTLETFVDEVLRADTPVVADFWAPWCGPCKAMAPIFEELAAEYRSSVKFVKVNTEAEPQLAAQFQITSIPTLLVFSDGQLVDGAVGALPRSQLKALVERVAGPARADAADAGGATA
jgi:thioredoxin